MLAGVVWSDINLPGPIVFVTPAKKLAEEIVRLVDANPESKTIFDVFALVLIIKLEPIPEAAQSSSGRKKMWALFHQIRNSELKLLLVWRCRPFAWRGRVWGKLYTRLVQKECSYVTERTRTMPRARTYVHMRTRVSILISDGVVSVCGCREDVTLRKSDRRSLVTGYRARATLSIVH